MHIIAWHDLINNAILKISKHSTNNDTRLSPNQLIKTFKSFPNLYCIVYCQRNGTPNVFYMLNKLLKCFVVAITKHVFSKSEQLNNTRTEMYRVLNQSIDQELRTLCVTAQLSLDRTRFQNPWFEENIFSRKTNISEKDQTNKNVSFYVSRSKSTYLPKFNR